MGLIKSFVTFLMILISSCAVFYAQEFGREGAPAMNRPAAASAVEATTPEVQQQIRDNAQEGKPFVATVGADGVQRVEIVGGEYYFDPNYIVVKVNVPVELSVKKSGGHTPHSIVVKAPHAGINFSESLAQDPKTIKFTPTAVGKYEMYCNKKLPFAKSHKDKGMVGVIEVVE